MITINNEKKEAETHIELDLVRLVAGDVGEQSDCFSFTIAGVEQVAELGRLHDRLVVAVANALGNEGLVDFRHRLGAHCGSHELGQLFVDDLDCDWIELFFAFVVCLIVTNSKKTSLLYAKAKSVKCAK